MFNIIWKIKRLFNIVRQYVRYKVLQSRGIRIGKKTYIAPTAYIDSHKNAKVVIGTNCYITRNVIILNHSDTICGGPLNIWREIGGKRIFGDVKIGDNVFIGVGSVIMPGVTVGDNTIIGALSLVIKDIPSNEVWAGNPAKFIENTSEHINKNI